MKRLNVYFLMLMMGLIFFTACNDDENDPVFDSPEIEAVDAQIQQKPGETTNIRLNASADAGIKSITVSGDAEGNVTFDANDKSQMVTYPFTVPGDAEEGDSYEFTFTLTDKQDRTDAATVTVVATALPGQNIILNTSGNGLADLEGFDDETNTYTLLARNTYTLEGFVFVNEGQTIEIEAGTVIKGMPGQGGGASALVISRGGKIMANGTRENPIIFTGLADNLEGSVPDDAEALWGGLIVLGNAPTNNINDNDDATGGLKAIEGLPTDGLEGDPFYGGDDVNDNSGVIRYVSIRHGGSLIGGDNEINGLTLGGVGAGTIIEYVEVWSNLDDGIEWFGGTVNAKYLVASYIGDDGFDYDEGFSGSVQFGFIYAGETNVKDDSWGGEHDGGVGNNEASMPYAKPKFYNITSFGVPNMLGTMLLRDNAGGEYHNSIFANYEKGVSLEIRTDIESSYDRLQTGDLKLENNIWYNVADGTPANIFTIITAGTVDPTVKNNAASYFTNYFTSSGNTTTDPEFNGIVPGSNEAVISGLSEYPDDGFFEQVNYKGAFEPDVEPWIAGWTKTWEVINK